ncbi:unnamed protein product [Moneuplotes crassus]|uniref:Uncharacterized protein n=1 Tax=Euplotes crassus TaxID=5936 RepID=A0AAD2D8C8_EUPCR|nr:unnamed protein product [Moneuplotes crassus]
MELSQVVKESDLNLEKIVLRLEEPKTNHFTTKKNTNLFKSMICVIEGKRNKSESRASKPDADGVKFSPKNTHLSPIKCLSPQKSIKGPKLGQTSYPKIVGSKSIESSPCKPEYKSHRNPQSNAWFHSLIF